MKVRADRFTTRASKALHLADEEAQRLRHTTLGPQHLLLGLVREGEGLAAIVLRRHGIELGPLRQAVAAAGGPSAPGGTHGGKPRADPTAEWAVDRAYVEARNLGHNFVGTEHLLLAVLGESEGAALELLRALGADPDQIGADLVNAVSVGGPVAQLRGPKDHVLTCRVEDHALDAIDALVEAGIRSTRSDAAAWLIRSGIEANREFFEQVYTTVGEIRRLRQQAQALARQSPSG